MAATVEYETPFAIDVLYQLVLMFHIDQELFAHAAAALMTTCVAPVLFKKAA